MLETKCLGDKNQMLVTNLDFCLLKLVSRTVNTHQLSPTNSRQHDNVTNSTVAGKSLPGELCFRTFCIFIVLNLIF